MNSLLFILQTKRIEFCVCVSRINRFARWHFASIRTHVTHSRCLERICLPVAASCSASASEFRKCAVHVACPRVLSGQQTQPKRRKQQLEGIVLQRKYHLSMRSIKTIPGRRMFPSSAGFRPAVRLLGCSKCASPTSCKTSAVDELIFYCH